MWHFDIYGFAASRVQSGLCYNSGFGDQLHSIAHKVDSIVDKAPAPLKKAYQVRTYPKSALPEQSQVEDVANWMVQKGYLKKSIAYNDFVYSQK